MIAREELGPRFVAAVACREAGAVPVPDAVGGPGTRGLAEALGERRSVRAYACAPISQTVLDAVIEAGMAVDRELWGGDGSGDSDLSVVVLADRVTSLAPGVYEYSPGATRTRRAPLAAMTDHVFQPDLAAAAAVIVIRGDLEAAVRRHGPHGYRRLLTRAGAVVAACHLAALRAGLHGCPFDGLLPEGADRVRDLSLFALALGLPEAGEADPARRSV